MDGRGARMDAERVWTPMRYGRCVWTRGNFWLATPAEISIARQQPRLAFEGKKMPAGRPARASQSCRSIYSAWGCLCGTRPLCLAHEAETTSVVRSSGRAFLYLSIWQVGRRGAGGVRGRRMGSHEISSADRPRPSRREHSLAVRVSPAQA